MRRFAMVVLPVALVLALVGCSEGSAPRAQPTPSATATALVTPSAAASTPAAEDAFVEPTAKPTGIGRLVRLTGEGIDLPFGYALFGQSFAEVEPGLRRVLGRPTKDTGVRSSSSDYGTCPGTKLRALEYGGGALRVLFGDTKAGGGPLTMYQWALTPDGKPATVPPATAFVSDRGRLQIAIDTTLAEITKGTPARMLELTKGDETFAPSFSISDGTSFGVYGSLTDTTPSGKATFIQGGMSCGE
jgi:hypothetical protein